MSEIASLSKSLQKTQPKPTGPAMEPVESYKEITTMNVIELEPLTRKLEVLN
jgi:hypothetical protein